jgi:isoleucyl-tRNA synthetase
MAELAITSGLALEVGPPPAGSFTLDDVPGVGVMPALAAGDKCQRCWRVLPEVGADAPELCRRCADAVDHPAAA